MKANDKLPIDWDAAKSIAARCLASNRRLRGMPVEHIADDIELELIRRSDELEAARNTRDEARERRIIGEATSVAVNAAVCAMRKAQRALVPFQLRQAAEGKRRIVRNGLWDPVRYDARAAAIRELAQDMADIARCHSRSERMVYYVRTTLAHMTLDDRRVALSYMRNLSWGRVALEFGRSEGDFRRKVLPGFVARFKEVWKKVY